MQFFFNQKCLHHGSFMGRFQDLSSVVSSALSDILCKQELFLHGARDVCGDSSCLSTFLWETMKKMAESTHKKPCPTGEALLGSLCTRGHDRAEREGPAEETTHSGERGKQKGEESC